MKRVVAIILLVVVMISSLPAEIYSAVDMTTEKTNSLVLLKLPI